MRRSLAIVSARLPMAAVLLTWLCLGEATYAARQPPLAFDEEITVVSGGVVNIALRHFDPSAEIESRGFSITEGPQELAFCGGSAGAQSCAFAGSCAFFTGSFVGRTELRFRVSTRQASGAASVASLPGIITIDVVESVDQPLAFPQTVRTVAGAAVPINLSGLGTVGSELNFEVTAGPVSGVLSATAGSTEDAITYAPDAGFKGGRPA